ncbi:MAG: EAL domain-containing protein [Gammaproteobacteria bacterium]|nr:EAL domain-containing protein [Gammaproteobacteria bacterium]
MKPPPGPIAYEAPREVALLHDLARELDVERFFGRAAAGIAGLLHADGAALIVREPPDQLCHRFVYGLPAHHQDLVAQTFSERVGLPGAVLRAGAPVFVPNYPESPEALPEHIALGLAASFCAPVRAEGEIIAVLAIFWFTAPAHPPDAASTYLIEVVTDFIGAALHRARMQQRLLALATRDPLTGVANRHLFFDRLEHAMASAERANRLVAVVVIDVDNFKIINDHFGSAAGDEVLIEIKDRISGVLRKSDTIARIGGDEFGLVIENAARVGDLEAVALRVCDALQFHWGVPGDCIAISVSIGMTIYPLDSGSAQALLGNADTAMREARQRGGHMLLSYAHDLAHQSLSRDAIIWEFSHGLDDGQMRLVFQPIVDMTSGTLMSVEALLRWEHPTRGLLAPGAFMAALEHGYNSSKLDAWVLERAVEVLAGWRRKGLDWILHVNLTMSSVANPQFHTLLERALSGPVEVDAAKLGIELVEWGAIRGADAACQLIRDCKKMGMSVVLDDFGTGYASLQHLRLLPIDHIKIDRSFVRELMTNDADRVLVDSIISAARAFGIGVIAEGVEREEQRDLLLAVGCHMGQGYLFARPMPEDELLARYAPV